MVHIWMDMAQETALDHDDPVLTTKEAAQAQAIVLERYASKADGPVAGTGYTKMELMAYFARQTVLQDYST